MNYHICNRCFLLAPQRNKYILRFNQSENILFFLKIDVEIKMKLVVFIFEDFIS